MWGKVALILYIESLFAHLFQLSKIHQCDPLCGSTSPTNTVSGPVRSVQVRSSVHDWWIILFCGVSKQHHFFFLHLVHVLMTYLCRHDFYLPPSHDPWRLHIYLCPRLRVRYRLHYQRHRPKVNWYARTWTRRDETQRWRDDEANRQ